MKGANLRPSRRGLQHGLSLVELMIAITLGLLLIVAVSSVFLSNKQSYRTNQGLSEIQDNSRIAFELMARDLRQIGVTGCGNFGRVANVLNNGPNNGGTAWWANFDNAIVGYDGGTADPAVATGSGTAQRVAGTSSLTVIGASDPVRSVSSHNYNGAGGVYTFQVNEPAVGLQNGDIAVVCDPDHAAILQAIQVAGNTLTYSGSASPGNCTLDLGFPTACSSVTNRYQYQPNAQLAKLTASDWYIGNNPQVGRSLYRMTLINSGGGTTTQAQEMVRNVTNMQLAYHRTGDTSFQTAAGVGSAANWLIVDAVQITLPFLSTDTGAGTNAQPLTRQLSATVNLRNRV